MGGHIVTDATRQKMSESAKRRCTPEWRERMREQSTKVILDMNTVWKLYQDGYTQDEVASILGTTQKVIWKRMKQYGLPARKAVVRQPKYGSDVAHWKGDKALYAALHAALHLRLEAKFGKAKVYGQAHGCSVCGDKTQKRYEWANLTGNYVEMDDYTVMCVFCHRRYDKARRDKTGKPTITAPRKRVVNNA